jgi:spore coat protein A
VKKADKHLTWLILIVMVLALCVTPTLAAPSVTAIPVINLPVTDQDTSVRGTAVPKAIIILSVNGIAQPAVTATGGKWTVSGLSLKADDIISVTAQKKPALISAAAITTVVVGTLITAKPVIELPVTDSDTSVSGTAEADANVVLSLNGIAQPAVTATGGNWTVSGLTLVIGDAISVTAQKTGKLISAPATTTVAASMTTAPPVIELPVTNQHTSVSGTAVPYASVVLSVNGIAQPAVMAAGGYWTVSGLTLTIGDVISVTALKIPGPISAASTTIVVAATLVTAAPVILIPVSEGDTSVSGTAEADASVVLSLNGVAQPAVIAKNGNWTVSGLTLVTGDTISVTAQKNGKLISAPVTTIVAVKKTTAAPVINLPVYTGVTSVSGTAEADASVVLSINGIAQPAVVANGGNWTVSGLTLATGDTISVTAQTNGKLISAPVTATVEASTPVIQLIGSNPDSVTLDSVSYADPGAVANDPVYGNLTGSIIVTGTVDTTVLGPYELIYTVTNASEVTSSVTRTVNVVAQLDPLTIPQFETPLLIPWAMPKSPNVDPGVDYYEIAMRQFEQQVLPAGMPTTTVWGYGSATDPGAVFHAPSLTIEAQVNRPVRIKWINDLIDANGNYLPHLLPIDQTLHWANPVGGTAGRDMAGTDPNPYVGPVPIVTHVHGAHVSQESDGYPEAWYLPAANNIPAGYATKGSLFNKYKATAASGDQWQQGSVVYDYPNDQSASTVWYHDHALGMTRTNVYAGPAGFYLLRGGATDQVYEDAARTIPGVLPSGDYEIPVAIQDRSFNSDGSLFYPDSRTFFDGFAGPYVPDSDISPIWNPEFFGDTIIANGKTWPFQTVEQKQYRFRFLNGSQSRTLILRLSDGSPFWQIGAEGGFLAQPVQLNELLMGPAERADVLIDFTNIPEGTNIILENIGPDGPFQGGVSGVDFDPANSATTGKVMEFRVVAANTADPSTPADQLVLPTITPLGASDNLRKVSLNEEESELLPGDAPKAAKLGTVTMNPDTGMLEGVPQMWMSAITENVTLGDTETWEIYNFTMDAHPIHLHLVTFEVLERQVWDPMTGTYGAIIPAQPWESGFKDTVLAYPGQITRIKAKFDVSGLYVWHCHILEHEDNEMMRPYQVLAPGVDGAAPVITILGNNPVTVPLNSVYTDAGATAMDNVDGDVTANIVTMNMVDTSVAGMYMVHYSVTDAAGNTAMEMRMVMVE